MEFVPSSVETFWLCKTHFTSTTKYLIDGLKILVSFFLKNKITPLEESNMYHMLMHHLHSMIQSILLGNSEKRSVVKNDFIHVHEH